MIKATGKTCCLDCNLCFTRGPSLLVPTSTHGHEEWCMCLRPEPSLQYLQTWTFPGMFPHVRVSASPKYLVDHQSHHHTSRLTHPDPEFQSFKKPKTELLYVTTNIKHIRRNHLNCINAVKVLFACDTTCKKRLTTGILAYHSSRKLVGRTKLCAKLWKAEAVMNSG
jgi:hypothetical protein